MRIALTFSGLLNLGLIACLVLALASQGKRGANAPQVPVQPTTAAISAAESAAPPVIVQRTETAPFRWSQLESADYRTYIKNLRAVGCPEGTVRAIVAADVDLVYQDRSRSLEKQLADLANSSWSVRLASGSAEQAMKDEMLKLPAEEISEIDQLLGITPPPIQVATSTSSPTLNAGESDESQPPPPVAMPLALRNIDTSALGLSDEQIQEINNLRQQFVATIGGPNQDPNDPAYLARWQENAPVADNMLRLTMGNDAYAKYLMMDNQSENQGQPHQ